MFLLFSYRILIAFCFWFVFLINWNQCSHALTHAFLAPNDASPYSHTMPNELLRIIIATIPFHSWLQFSGASTVSKPKRWQATERIQGQFIQTVQHRRLLNKTLHLKRIISANMKNVIDINLKSRCIPYSIIFAINKVKWFAKWLDRRTSLLRE